MPTLDFISLIPWTFIVMIANLYILYRVLRRFLFKPVQSMLAKRQEEIDGIYEGANKASFDAENTKKLYDEKLENAESEAKAIISSASSAARKKEAEIIGGAKIQAQNIIVKAEADVVQIQRKAAAVMKDDISQMAVDIARKITEKEIDAKDHEALIENYIERLEKEQ